MKSLFQLALALFSTVLRAWNKPWIKVKKLASSRSIFTPINFHVLFFSLKVQRLVTPIMLQRKRHRLAIKRKRAEKNRQVMFWFHGKNLFYHSFMHMEYFDFTSFFYYLFYRLPPNTPRSWPPGKRKPRRLRNWEGRGRPLLENPEIPSKVHKKFERFTPFV